MGIWRAEKTITLDNLTGFWMPDTNLVYGDNLEKLGLSDTRTVIHDQRFLLTTNEIDPKVYVVTKVVEVSPIGVLRVSIKEDEFNPNRDNIKLRICDYYTNVGDLTMDVEEPIPPSPEQFTIVEMVIDENGELIDKDTPISSVINIGNISYYRAIESGCEFITAVWTIESIDSELSEEEKKRLVGLIKLTTYDGNVVSVKPGKANSLIGKHFRLIATNDEGDYKTEIEWEVGADET